MTMKMKFTKHYMLALVLAGSLSPIKANKESFDDKIQAPEYRLQITGATEQILTAIAAESAALVLNTRAVVLNQVFAAGSNAAINLPIAGPTAAADFNLAMLDVFDALTTAMTTSNNTNILALQTSITAAQAVDIVTGGAVSTAYPAESVTSGLQQLQTAVTNWLVLYPA